MPNYCDFDLAVVGKRKKVAEFLKILSAHYDYDEPGEQPRHLFRVFNVWELENYDTIEEFLDNEAEEFDNNIIGVIVSGICAWSVNTCMTENGYYKDVKKAVGDRFNGTTLQIESKRLKLEIEVYGVENTRLEHYEYSNGKIIAEEYKEFKYIGYDNEEASETLGLEEPLSLKELEEQYNVYYCDLFSCFIQCGANEVPDNVFSWDVL